MPTGIRLLHGERADTICELPSSSCELYKGTCINLKRKISSLKLIVFVWLDFSDEMTEDQTPIVSDAGEPEVGAQSIVFSFNISTTTLTSWNIQWSPLGRRGTSPARTSVRWINGTTNVKKKNSTVPSLILQRQCTPLMVMGAWKWIWDLRSVRRNGHVQWEYSIIRKMLLAWPRYGKAGTILP